jgi:GNAT superfamily N-acetyltransferase
MLPLHPALVQQLAADRIAGELRDADTRRRSAVGQGSRLARRLSAAPPAVPADAREPRIVLADATHGDAMRAFLRRLSPQTSYRRFATAAQVADVIDVDLMLAADPCHRGFVALAGDRIVGHAHAVAAPDDDLVEMGVVVADEWQRHGIGPRLVRSLLETEPASGAAELEFFVLAANMPARRLVRGLWPEATGTPEGELVHFRVLTAAGRARQAAVPASLVRLTCHA